MAGIRAFRFRTGTALLLQGLGLALCLAALLGARWPSQSPDQGPLVLLDRSASVPREAGDRALAELLRSLGEQRRTSGATVIEFAGRARAPVLVEARGSARVSVPGEELEDTATDFEGAFDAAFEALELQQSRELIVISDGHSTRGSIEAGLRTAALVGTPVRWMAVSGERAGPWISDVLAPRRARSGGLIELRVRAEGLPPGFAATVSVTATQANGEATTAAAAVEASGLARVELQAGGAGPLLLDLALEDGRAGELLDRRDNAAVITVEAAAQILYAGAARSALASSLAAGGWSLDVVDHRTLGSMHERLRGYDAIVLDDVPVSSADARFWNSLLAAVREEGVGLLVLGGEHAYAAGSYRGSVLEQALPVLAEPAALADATSVVFAVDKSGSMGERTAGVDRFALARAAVLGTLEGLSTQDSVAVVLFDAEARILLPMSDPASAQRELSRDWAARAAGGTRLRPALEAALGEFAAAQTRRRLLVLVTDGFVDALRLEDWRERLAGSDVELVALAIGPEANLDALDRLAGSTGMVLPVREAAELPSIMRSAFERMRAPVERGGIAARELIPTGFIETSGGGWPDVGAYAVTRASDGADVYVESAKGDPLVASSRYGLGRVVAVTTAFDAWAPLWIRWTRWPELAAGLMDWVAREDNRRQTALRVQDQADALLVTVDSSDSLGWRRSAEGRLLVTGPSREPRAVALRPVAAGRMSAAVERAEPGLYRLTAELGGSRSTVYHLRREAGELDFVGTNPDLARWQADGLLKPWAADAQPTADASRSPATAADRRAYLVSALGVFLLAVVCDRLRLPRDPRPWTWLSVRARRRAGPAP
jgi:uncharacterized membrane protein